MKWACWMDLVLLAIWGCLYCAEEVRLAGRRWWDRAVLGCFRRWVVNAAKDRVVVARPLTNYLVQAAQADNAVVDHVVAPHEMVYYLVQTQQADNALNDLRESGWTETGPGVWTSPDGKSTVMM